MKTWSADDLRALLHKLDTLPLGPWMIERACKRDCHKRVVSALNNETMVPGVVTPIAEFIVEAPDLIRDLASMSLDLLTENENLNGEILDFGNEDDLISDLKARLEDLEAEISQLRAGLP